MFQRGLDQCGFLVGKKELLPSHCRANLVPPAGSNHHAVGGCGTEGGPLTLDRALAGTEAGKGDAGGASRDKRKEARQEETKRQGGSYLRLKGEQPPPPAKVTTLHRPHERQRATGPIDQTVPSACEACQRLLSRAQLSDLARATPIVSGLEFGLSVITAEGGVLNCSALQ
ncbi:hypothetical protein AAFF_G00191330 [Aldrovandia affinis]|uniref:Uncharacterized protein n=1 Tax=Aldrovandia affinis TaxID=143900 RepID=A0AAD7W5Q9_9TELE|nr:hypothetical protein AAFF_G00191330 [Aldrovandia affinis]